MAHGDSKIPAPLLMASALLAAVCLHLFFYKLDAEGVTTEAEARVLVGAVEMDRESNWVSWTVGGEPQWDKPPLYIWMVQLAADLQNEFSPQVARLPGALCATIVVLLAGWWAFRHMGRYPREDDPDMGLEGPALLAGLLLATNPIFFKFARAGVADSAFALFCFGALYCFAESLESRRGFFSDASWRRRVLVGYALTGLATATKGPTAFLFVLAPYVATCRHYKLNRPDWIHAVGLALASAIGGWWYAAALIQDPSAGRIFVEELIGKRFGADAWSRGPIHYYIVLLAVGFFPWILASGGMIHNVLIRHQRTPTRLMWTWSVATGVAWLSLVGTKRQVYLLPIAPCLALLAADALSHWSFDTAAGRAFRVLNRILRWALIVLGFAASVLLASDLGIAFSIALAVASFWFLFYRRRRGIVFAKWERTMQGAWFLVACFLAVQTIYIREYISRKEFLDPLPSYMRRVSLHLPPKADIRLLGKERRALHEYLLDEFATPVSDPDEALVLPERDEPEAPEPAIAIPPPAPTPDPGPFLLVDDPARIREISARPDFAMVVSRLDPGAMEPASAMFRALPGVARDAEPSWDDRITTASAFRMAFFGDAGRDRGGEKDVVKRIEGADERAPLDGVVVLGDALAPVSRLNRIDFIKSFERPYKRLLERGLPFHGVLGRRDLDIAPVLARYPILRMGGRRAYATDFRGGFVRFYALDAYAEGEEMDKQLAWLEKDLADADSGDAPGNRPLWKIVAVHRPLLSLAAEADNDAALAERLLPILDRGGADVVVWSGEPWYQRVEDPAFAPVFFGVGFGSEAVATEFLDDPRLKARSGTSPGFLLLEAGPKALRFEAIDEANATIDAGEIPADRAR